MRQGFNPRLPGGRRPEHGVEQRQQQMVSIHAFRGEGDATQAMRLDRRHAFQSTPSGGKATLLCYQRAIMFDVSIHAFRGEGDRMRSMRLGRCLSFNPRLPGGRRLAADDALA